MAVRRFLLHNFLEFFLDDTDWPAPCRRNLCDFWAPYAVPEECQQGSDTGRQRRPPIRLEVVLCKSLKRPVRSINIDNQIWGTSGELYQQFRYKTARYAMRLLGWRDTENLRLEISGNYASHWVWPFQLFGDILRWLLCLREVVIPHAVGLELDGRAALLAGSSGVGKTLTTLGWLRKGCAYYGDDRVFLGDGNLFGHWNPVNFWLNRYQGQPQVASLLPLLQRPELRHQRFWSLVRFLTAGYVNIATALPPLRYFPEALARPAPVRVAFSLRRGARLQMLPPTDSAQLGCRLLADLRLEAVNVLRLEESVALLEPRHPLASWSVTCARVLTETLAGAVCYEVEVPGVFDPSLLVALEQAMRAVQP